MATPLKLLAGQIAQLQSTDKVSPGFLINSGVSSVLFPPFPGASDASLFVSGQTNITASSTVWCWINYAATTDHSADEHRVESLSVLPGPITPGVGFGILVRNANQLSDPSGVGTRLYGQWSIAWAWI